MNDNIGRPLNMNNIGIFISSGRRCLIKTNYPKERCEEILKQYPDAKLKVMRDGVLINE